MLQLSELAYELRVSMRNAPNTKRQKSTADIDLEAMIAQQIEVDREKLEESMLNRIAKEMELQLQREPLEQEKQYRKEPLQLLQQEQKLRDVESKPRDRQFERLLQHLIENKTNKD
ncbi:hypothetical protein PF001_g3768 [Phytophthora fragariae]|uniref:Uncharacterized protein n=1 Tax=Phytophthora fragariae TaxID=53985 RepID=A0A6A4ESV2_9STRA|nr:hypothetical protein PF009_g4235 [Phytophthora fragariae]KAE9151407.1 hypothetical protein PF006_g4289 [Phytophthora fragariae]KAE9323768.1 hypothetical protein PF001_g3768 [Phytophthora fragariae]